MSVCYDYPSPMISGEMEAQAMGDQLHQIGHPDMIMQLTIAITTARRAAMLVGYPSVADTLDLQEYQHKCKSM